MAIPSVTTFVETAALYAVLTDDMETARRIVTEMHPGERAAYAEQLDRLRELLGARCEACDELTPVGTSVTANPLILELSKYLCRTCADTTRHSTQP
ncbi:hypothetical protein AB0B12_37965 [Streptomyces sp. NPDC044780]|uniref:hypothetical protein n=1 Tax=unclassified Streptomyces TaxID=2593676 RepID=UPI0033E967D2